MAKSGASAKWRRGKTSGGKNQNNVKIIRSGMLRAHLVRVVPSTYACRRQSVLQVRAPPSLSIASRVAAARIAAAASGVASKTPVNVKK
jgi:hypothetical protein